MPKRTGWIVFVVCVIGLAVTLPLFLLGIISERVMIGLTLFLSWAAPAIEAGNTIFMAKAQDADDGSTACPSSPE